VNHRRRKNFISHLKVDGALVSDQDEKSSVVDAFYGDLLGFALDRPFSLDLDFLGVWSHDLSQLEEPFSEEDLWFVLRSQELDKAPGPDGFFARFYVACWHIIKPDVMAAFHALWSGDCRGLHAANQALVSLLPKHADAVEVKYFRPVRLIHSGAKLSVFIRGCCLHDNFQLVHCTARKVHAVKRDVILLKLDITKAFDN
jgi:hypothetical protein